MRKDIAEFWKHNAPTNIIPNTGEEFPEGWNVREFFRNFMSEQEYGKVLDIGCGYGRLCEAFNPDYYTGLDISERVLQSAKFMFPKYNFTQIDENELLFPECDTALLYTVLLHQADADVESLIESICKTSKRVIVAEICGRDWRRSGNPPVFNREPQDYDLLFRKYGKPVFSILPKPYIRYKDFDKSSTNLSIMVFQ